MKPLVAFEIKDDEKSSETSVQEDKAESIESGGTSKKEIEFMYNIFYDD